ncbi:MAG TPA: signal peptide peptidase SppA [Candidatus Cloacimonadota bacterium]|jgi:protease-4|nr:signal peptide peptidase SppA [Candidatus Cloacimonadales bacterium]HOE90662.1 signal peptide peptidase SppA [Candidatus Cloacimonadota bacterium]HPY96624.1 signal peptide peptidase SppA [Candidatus Cloacimonadota bacterium]HQB40949.1 signal peptide peptidase SppA [Candidatus Cloacimonadota bacterium]
MRTKWYLLGCGTSILLLFLVFVFGIRSLMKTSQQATVKVQNNSALVIDIDKLVPEYSDLTDSHFNLIPISAHDIIEKINSAATDPKIKCIILKPNNYSIGYASLHEIMLALAEFKTTGKKVYAYLNFVGQKDYILSTVADEIYLNPSATAGVYLTGVGSSITFYKDMLSKLGIEVNIVRAGKYKAAGESFSRNNMSAEFKNNLMGLYEDIYVQLCADLAKNRNIEDETVRNIFENRANLFIAQDEALNFKMVDGLIQEDQMLKNIGIDKDHMVSISKYQATPIKQKNQKIAVIYAMGEINSVKANIGTMNINSKNMKEVVSKVKEDNSIKAVVLRVNSPGGSALESDIINYYIEELKKVKPVIVSMGDVAASGGYYISANANYIYADPYTITGSIGVISMLPDVNKLGKKIGLSSESAGYGKFINVLEPWKPTNPNMLSSFQDMTDRTYLEFKTVVSRGRGIDVDTVDDIAQGQVWSAPDAKAHKLIDEVGTLNDAILKAAELVNLTDYSVASYPQKKDLINAVLQEKFDLQVALKVLSGKYTIEDIPNHIENTLNSIIESPVQMKLPFSLDN